MRSKWTSEQLNVAVERYNEMARGLAIAAPLVAQVLDGAKITGNKVGKSERDKIKAIVGEHVPGMPDKPWGRCYLNTDYSYTLYLNADINAPTGDHGCNYAHVSIAVAQRSKESNGNNVLIPRWEAVASDMPKPITVSEVERLIQLATEAEEAANAAISAASTAKIAANPFIE